LPAYVLFFIYIAITQKQPVPWWMALLFIVAIALGVMQMPGTITLTPTAITQRFWFQPSKTIQYNEVMAIQAMQAGRMTSVLGDNRVKITHTSNHCAALEFQRLPLMDLMRIRRRRFGRRVGRNIFWEMWRKTDRPFAYQVGEYRWPKPSASC